MITWKTGNMLDIKEGVIVHGCNLVGGFGSGIAGQIARRWPSVRDQYMEEFCSHRLGQWHSVAVDWSKELLVVNAFTQQKCGGPGVKWASADAILVALSSILFHYQQIGNGYYKVHIPLIGCGLGGLDWETEVKPLYEYLGTRFDFTVWQLEGQSFF